MTEPLPLQTSAADLRARALWFRARRQVDVGPYDITPPGDGEVLVRTQWSGISAGTEMLAYRGELDPDMPLDETLGSYGGTFAYPFRYGYSCVGRVERSRAALPEGATVFAFHPHQDRFTVPAEDVVVLPDVPPRIATLFPLVETALQITLDAGPRLGERVAVTGLGTVGLLVALLLERSGADVVATDPVEWRRALARELDVEAVAPHDLDGPLPLLVEVSGNPQALADGLELLAHEGVALVASWYGTKPAALPLGSAFHRRRLTIRSTQVSTLPSALSPRWTRARRRDVATALLRELPAAALATHAFAFADAAAAFAAVDRGEEGLLHAALRYE